MASWALHFGSLSAGCDCNRLLIEQVQALSCATARAVQLQQFLALVLCKCWVGLVGPTTATGSC
jgi:hypothetical protein